MTPYPTTHTIKHVFSFARNTPKLVRPSESQGAFFFLATLLRYDMDKEQALITSLWEENRELKNKLKKANRRYRYLTNVVRKLKKGLHKGGNLETKHYDDTAEQADERTRDIQHNNRGTGGDIRATRAKFRLQFGNGGSYLQSDEGREDAE